MSFDIFNHLFIYCIHVVILFNSNKYICYRNHGSTCFHDEFQEPFFVAAAPSRRVVEFGLPNGQENLRAISPGPIESSQEKEGGVQLGPFTSYKWL